jgi:glycosyltransferase involved in cell wall biosynthesis
MVIRDPYIVVVDLYWQGHVPQYHKFFIKSFLDRGYCVLSVTTAFDEIEKWSKSLSRKEQSRFSAIQFHSTSINNTESIKIFFLKFLFLIITRLQVLRVPKTAFFYKVLSVLFNWVNLNSIIKEFSLRHHSKPRLVFIGYLDSEFIFPGITSKVVDSFFHYPWSGAYLGPKNFRSSIPKTNMSLAERYLPSYDILLSKNLSAIFVSDEGVVNSMENYMNNPVLFLPELMDKSLPSMESKLARLIKKKAGNRKIVSLLGVIAERKGIELFVDSANKLLLENVFFLVAGKVYKEKQTEFVLSKLSTLQENSYTYLETIQGDEYFNELIQLSDIVFLGYKAFFHGSGILTKAAYFKKTVIATKGHCIGERVDKYKLGITIEEDNIDQCINSIKSLIKNDSQNFNFEFNDYLEIHSIETFNKSMDEFVILLNQK